MKHRYVLFFDLAWTGYSGWARYDTKKDDWHSYGAFRPKQAAPHLERAAEIEFKSSKLAWEINRVLAGSPKDEYVGYELADWHHGSDVARNVGKDRIVLPALAMAELTLIMACRERIVRALGSMQIKSDFGSQTKDGVARLIAAQWPERFQFERHKHGFLRADGKLLRHDITDALAGAYVLTGILNLERMIESTD
jgi:hypothetical protein